MSEPITFDEFAKVEIRIGTVVEAEVPEGSRSVIKLTVDFGEGVGTKTIFTGILKWFQPEDLRGKQFPFVINIPPRQMGNLGVSEGMVMAVVENEGKGEAERVVLLKPDGMVKTGSQVR